MRAAFSRDFEVSRIRVNSTEDVRQSRSNGQPQLNFSNLTLRPKSENLSDGHCQAWQRDELNSVARPDHADVRVRPARPRLAVDLDERVHEVDDPILGDASLGVESAFNFAVVFE